MVVNIDNSKFYDYYKTLHRGEKSKFLAFLSLSVGGSYRTWMNRISKKEQAIDTLNAPTREYIFSLIEKDSWRDAQ